MYHACSDPGWSSRQPIPKSTVGSNSGIELGVVPKGLLHVPLHLNKIAHLSVKP